jgi:rSAM/selenodomain-associated transferase 1
MVDRSELGRTAVGIICKTPLTGSSKTRLAPFLGPDGAAELAACFLKDVSAAIEAVPGCCGLTGYAVYAPEGTESVLRTLLPPSFGLVCRHGDTLEHVLHGATAHFLNAGHDGVILVNGDSPTLPPLTIAAAMATLRQPGDRAVFGPASDGGYYLIGLKAAHAALFRDIPWSTERTLAVTLERAAGIGLAVAQLPVWYDVDDVETMRLLLDELAGRRLPFDSAGLQGGPARATREFIAARPWLAEALASPCGQQGGP